MGPVVVGIDESERSRTVLDRAVGEARRRACELHVVHVFQPPVIFAPYMGAAVDTVAMAEAEREAVWGQVQPVLDGANADWRRVDLEGHPARALVAHAADVDAVLLVLGSRGRGDLASLVLGSTSHAALHMAECDVLIVKHGLTEQPREDPARDRTAASRRFGNSGRSYATRSPSPRRELGMMSAGGIRT